MSADPQSNEYQSAFHIKTSVLKGIALKASN